MQKPSFNPWAGEIPWRRKWQPIPVFLPGEFHGQRSLVGYSPYHKFMIYEIINYSLRSERVYQGP